jgi:non-canonical purine NTP pyrophosphatase (RdgB/HAM1 family)
MKVIFATSNSGKAKEVKDLFKNTEYEIFSLSDFGDKSEIEENGHTFEDNAIIKAKYIYDKYKVPVIADDSGLLVEQLNGNPGVYSARYAGEKCSYDDNNRKILYELVQFPEPHVAKFVCTAVFYNGENNIIVSNGELNGIIINEFKGSNGFGYDPIFVPESSELTLAEMTLDEKNKISHRSKAFNKLKEMMVK